MNHTKTTLIKCALMGVLGFHLIMHVLYLAPANPATSQYSDFTNQYMSSFFTQNWHLFAPEPATSSLQLSYRCNPTEEWQHPLQQLFSDHKSFPFTAKGKQTYVLQHLAREIFNAKIKDTADAEIREMPVLQRYLQDRCGKYAKAEVEIQRTFTTDYSKRFQKSAGQSQTYRFSLQSEALAWN